MQSSLRWRQTRLEKVLERRPLSCSFLLTLSYPFQVDSGTGVPDHVDCDFCQFNNDDAFSTFLIKELQGH